MTKQKKEKSYNAKVLIEVDISQFSSDSSQKENAKRYKGIPLQRIQGDQNIEIGEERFCLWDSYG